MGNAAARESFWSCHHNTRFARGGESTTDNLKLMCRAHNALLAERDFGRDFMCAKAERNVRNEFKL